MSLQIGSYQLASRALLAPMAGVTDAAQRHLCRQQGAGLTYSEMLTSDTRLWKSGKSATRLPNLKEPLPRPVQIAGYCPAMMAQAAAAAVALGASLIDINMGCPAKKVCKRDAGSALLRDEDLVKRILDQVVAAVDVPVTLKIRTGWDPQNRNAVAIAQIAEQAGIRALTVHGRTRACRFNGQAEYETIRQVVAAVTIPVIANGDIRSPADALDVMQKTAASGVMVGRAAQGNPWIFNRINRVLQGFEDPGTPARQEVLATLEQHIRMAAELYPAPQAARILRKHAGWYASTAGLDGQFRAAFNQLQCIEAQCQFVRSLADQPEKVAA